MMKSMILLGAVGLSTVCMAEIRSLGGNQCKGRGSTHAGWAYPINFKQKLEELAFDYDVEVEVRETKNIAGRRIAYNAIGHCADVKDFMDAYDRFINSFDDPGEW